MPDSQCKLFTHYHHLKVGILDDSVVELLWFKWTVRYQTVRGWRNRKNAREEKHDGASENYVGQKFLDLHKCQRAVQSAMDPVSIIVEMANVTINDGIEKCLRVKLNVPLGVSYVYEADYAVYDVKGCDLVLGKRWIRDTKHHHHINHDSNEMWIADNFWEDWVECRVYS